MNLSSRIMKMDVRLTGCGRDVDMTIQQAIKKNRLQKVRPPTLSSSSRSSSPASGGQTPTKEKKKYPYPKLWIHQIRLLLDSWITIFPTFSYLLTSEFVVAERPDL